MGLLWFWVLSMPLVCLGRRLLTRPVFSASACWAARGKLSLVSAQSHPHCLSAASSIFHCHVGRRCSSSVSADDDVDIDTLAYGFMASQALFASLEIGVFDHIAMAGGKGLTVHEISWKCKVAKPRVQTLLTSLTALRCLRRSPDGEYTLAPSIAKFAVKTSPHYYGDYLQHQIGRQFYLRMAALPQMMATGKAASSFAWLRDASWLQEVSSPGVAEDTESSFQDSQQAGSAATAKYIIEKKIKLGDITCMLDVGGGSGAWSHVFVRAAPNLHSTILELPEVCEAGESIRRRQPDIRNRIHYRPLDDSTTDWPVADDSFDLVLMSYISGSVPESMISILYTNAYKALRPGGRLLVHDFMVDDTLDGPPLGALWGLQQLTVNADGISLCPKEIISRMAVAGFNPSRCESEEMIHGMTKLIVAHKE